MQDDMYEKAGLSSLERLVGHAVSAVCFVQDYMQLQFDGLTLTCYTPPCVGVGDAEFRSGASEYRDRLVGLIGRVVQSVRQQDRIDLLIVFKTGECVKISLRDEDAAGPEAAMLHEPGKAIYDVWRYE
jgi:hypothetical protein